MRKRLTPPIAFGVATLISLAALATFGERSPGIFAIGALAMIVSILATVFVHELGHAVAGRLVGFKLVSFCVGPFRLSRYANRVRIGFNHQWTLLGYVASLPQGQPGLRWRTFIFSLGGPLANLLSLVPLVWLQTYIHVHSPWTFFATLTVTFSTGFSLVSGVLNMLPLSSHYPTDGAVMLMLLKGGPEAERYALLQAIGMATISGQRPNQWNPVWLDTIAVEWKSKSLQALAHFAAYLWALDSKQIELAERFLDVARERALSVPLLSDACAVEAAYYIARYKSDPIAARRCLSQTKSRPERASLLRAEAAILLAEGKSSASVATAKNALAELRHSHLSTAEAETQRDWISEIIQLANGIVSPTPAGDGLIHAPRSGT